MLDTLRDWKSLSAEEKTRLVAPMAKQGMSSSQIAKQFSDVTRNSIIGHCHRYDIPLGGNSGAKKSTKVKSEQPAKPHGNKGQPKANAIQARRVAREAMPELPVTPLPVDNDLPDVTALIGILDLTNDTCRYFHGDPLEKDGGFCGKPTREGSSYCSRHHRRCHSGFTKAEVLARAAS